ncbi:hypothetical protein C8263_18340 [Deinococcus arcticus]|uniref:Uncharacterized protein n=2 Tax=Deinococcus arcticus TaxID=2136176 RepID=A0A2T3W3E8_9DEIO|nr:hypothetical protein C8263_18340 [Deinococcus arcticus]
METPGTFTAEVFNPSGQKIKTASIDLADPQGIHFDAADVIGTGLYTVVLQGPQSSAIDLKAGGTSDLTVPLAMNTSVGFGPSKAGQYIHLPLTAEDGPLQLAFSNVTVNGSANVTTPSAGTQPLQAGTTTFSEKPMWEGPLAVKVVPGARSTVGGTLSVQGTFVDTSPIGAAPPLFTATFPEQWYRRKITTVAGQALGIAVSDVNQPGGANYGSIDAWTADGFSSAIYNGGFFQTLIVPDPGNGMTQVTARPMNGATSNTLKLHVGPSLPLTASSVTMTGAADAHTFAHVQVGPTEKLQVVISGLGVGTGQGRVYMQRPDNYYTYAPVTSGSDLIFRADGAVSSGLYAVTVDPPVGGSVTARLRVMTANPTVVDDQLATLNTLTANDTVVHNFSGTAATPRYLLLNGVTFSGATGSGKATLFAPSGNRTILPLASGTSRMLSNLNQDGPYSVMLAPPEGGKMSGHLMVSSGQTLPKAAVTPVNLTAGQGKVMTFVGEASTAPSVTLSGISPVPSAAQPVRVVIYRPDGLAVASQMLSAASGTLTVPGITSSTAGTYVVGVFPPDGQAVSFNIVQDTAAPVASVSDNQVVTFNTATINEVFARNFTGSTTPRYALIQGLTYTGATGNGTAALLQPNGNTSTVGLPSGSSWMFGNLNQNGTYNIKFTPPSGGKMSGSLLVSPGQALTKGSVTPINVTAGQGKVLTFTGAASTTPTVTLSGVSPVPTATQPVKVAIYRPDGNVVASQTLTSASGTLTVPNITSATAGTYVIGVFPPSGQAVSFNIVQDTAAPVASLADDQLLSFSTATTNEAFTRNFTGTSTPRYLILQGLTYSGATGNGTAALLSPSNTTSSIALPTGSSWMFGNLNQSGTYNIKVTPPSGGKVSGRVIESTGSALSTGVQSSHSIAAGQGKILTFAAASGTTPKLTFATLSPVPTTSAPVTVMVFRPDGNRVASATYTSSTYSTITLPSVTATTAGTYVVAVFPPNGQALTFKVTRN